MNNSNQNNDLSNMTDEQYEAEVESIFQSLQPHELSTIISEDILNDIINPNQEQETNEEQPIEEVPELEPISFTDQVVTPPAYASQSLIPPPITIPTINYSRTPSNEGQGNILPRQLFSAPISQEQLNSISVSETSGLGHPSQRTLDMLEEILGDDEPASPAENPFPQPTPSTQEEPIFEFGKIETPECSVCYKKINSDNKVVTPCKHHYCSDCFFKWLRESKSCAMCRRNLVDYTNWDYSPIEERLMLKAEFQLFRKLAVENRNNTLMNRTLVKKNRKLKKEAEELFQTNIRRTEEGEYKEGYYEGMFGELTDRTIRRINRLPRHSQYKQGFYNALWKKNGINMYKSNLLHKKSRKKKKKRKSDDDDEDDKTQTNLFNYGFKKGKYKGTFVFDSREDEDGTVRTYRRRVFVDESGMEYPENFEDALIIS